MSNQPVDQSRRTWVTMACAAGGVGGVAILCEVLTDNRNRTAPEVRKIFELAGGKLGSTGCVAWMVVPTTTC